MTDRDLLLERLEQLNPVPDPGRLYEDLDFAPRPALSAEERAVTLPANGPPTRRGLLVAAGVAALVFIVGAAISLVALTAEDPVAVDSRVLQLTIDGDSCEYEGPATLVAGEVEIIYLNTSPESRWANTLRLDNDRTVAEARDYLEEAPLAGAPSWSSPVLLALSVPTGGVPYSRVRALEPGTHLMLCGAVNRAAVLGADIVVTP